jgi:hypothetical protein
MDTYKRQFSWFGAALIIFGAALLLHKLHYVNVGFGDIFCVFMMLLGLGGVIRGFSENLRGKVFWSSVLFLYGVYFFLRNMDRFEFGYSYRLFMPASFLIFGIAFFMMFLNNVRDWHLLIPMFFLSGIGVAFLLSELGYIYYWDVWDVLHRYWPIVVILIGLALMIRRKPQAQIPSPPGQPTT